MPDDLDIIRRRPAATPAPTAEQESAASEPLKPRRRIVQQNEEAPKPAPAPREEKSSLAPLKPERAVVGPTLEQRLLGENDFTSLRQTAVEGLFYVPDVKDYLTPELIQTEVNTIIDRIANNQEAYFDLSRDQLHVIVFNAMRTRGMELLKQFETADAPEMRVRKRKEMLAEKERIAREEDAIEAVAKEELRAVIESLSSAENLSATQKSTLKYFYLIYVEGLKDPQIADKFPKSTRDQRYQWKARGIQMVLPHVSENTKRYLEWRAKRKFVSASDVFVYSKYFLSKIGDSK